MNDPVQTLRAAERVRRIVEGESRPRRRKTVSTPQPKLPRARADGVSWDEWSRLASEPEGRETGLHRDSMG